MKTKKDEIVLTDSQQSALDKISRFLDTDKSRIFILRGYAGTGKTTMVKVLLNLLIQNGTPYMLLASTGRAAKVLSDATAGVSGDNINREYGLAPAARTIHSQIYAFSDINQDLDLFSKTDEDSRQVIKLRFHLTHMEDDVNMVYIVDESSMISDEKDRTFSQAEYGTDGRLLHDLLNYDPNGKFIFIGDACQLPPVNQSFSPALNKEYIQKTFGINADEAELTNVVRQKNGNDITLSSARIRTLFNSGSNGNIAKFPFRGYKHIHLLRNELEMLTRYIECIKDKDFTAATMIVMSNKMVTSLSGIIRPALGLGSKTIMAGDLLLVTQNNMISGLMNGDLVIVTQIGKREKRAGLSFIHIEVKTLHSGRVYRQLLIEDILYSGVTNISQDQQTHLFIDFHKRMKKLGIKQKQDVYKEQMRCDPYLNALRCVFGYALTCHKAQGGEWDKVFLVIPRGLPYNNPRSYAYQWVYTAMTRAKKELYVIDDYWVSQ